MSSSSSHTSSFLVTSLLLHEFERSRKPFQQSSHPFFHRKRPSRCPPSTFSSLHRNINEIANPVFRSKTENEPEFQIRPLARVPQSGIGALGPFPAFKTTKGETRGISLAGSELSVMNSEDSPCTSPNQKAMLPADRSHSPARLEVLTPASTYTSALMMEGS